MTYQGLQQMSYGERYDFYRTRCLFEHGDVDRKLGLKPGTSLGIGEGTRRTVDPVINARAAHLFGRGPDYLDASLKPGSPRVATQASFGQYTNSRHMTDRESRRLWKFAMSGGGNKQWRSQLFTLEDWEYFNGMIDHAND